MNAYSTAMTPGELKTFHNLDRILYFRLASHQSLEPQISMKLVALMNWLESCGYSKVVYKLIQIPDSELLVFTRIAFYCLKFLLGEAGQERIAAFEALTGRTIRMLLGRDFSHWLLYENRDMALLEMGQFVEDVCTEDFCDSSDHRSLLAPLYNYPRYSAPCVLAQRYHLQFFHTKGLLELQDFSPWRQSKKERTLVVSFFRTHRFSRDELYDIFARQYGARVSAIHMKDGQENNNQPDVIFARVVLECREEIKKILEGDEKDGVLSSGSRRIIFVRRFVTLKEANDIHHSAQTKKQTQEIIFQLNEKQT